MLGSSWIHESSAWRSAYISSRSWPMKCASTRPSLDFSWQPDWRRGGPVGGKLCETGWHWTTYLWHKTICFCTNGVLFILENVNPKLEATCDAWTSRVQICTDCTVRYIWRIHLSPASHAKVSTHSDQVSNVNTICQIYSNFKFSPKI